MRYGVIAGAVCLLAVGNVGAQTATTAGPSAPTMTPTPSATAEWKAKLSLAKESDQYSCGRSTVTVVYSFVLAHDRLVIDTGAGTRTEAVVGPDGSVDHTFHTNKGNHPHVYGNVHTKHFKVGNGSCVYDALPVVQ
jgi:hypothetical protein